MRIVSRREGGKSVRDSLDIVFLVERRRRNGEKESKDLSDILNSVGVL